MKTTFITLFLILMALTANADGFVHPLDFKGSDSEKSTVVDYIKKNVKKTYSAIGMDNPSTLRMMENDELDNFKKLTKATDRKLLDRVIKTYCGIGMCTYNTIFMMYNEEKSASEQTLEW